jgi:hypothetical protein
MRCYQALNFALMLGVEGNVRHTWRRHNTTGVGVKAQPHGDNRLTAVVEIDQLVQFQPGHI